jgi:hypothetical protein
MQVMKQESQVRDIAGATQQEILDRLLHLGSLKINSQAIEQFHKGVAVG